MGKVKLDPMFMDLSKKVGNYVHAKWKGERVVRAYNGERPDPTAAQLEVQNAFKVAAVTWRRLPEVVKQSWKPYTVGKPVTELNLFIKENSNRQRTGNPYLLTKGNGMEKLNGLTVDSDTPGAVNIDFIIPGDPVNLTVILQGIEDGTGNSEISIIPDVYTGIRPVQITGLESGSELFLHCFTTDNIFNEAVQISESSGFRVTVA